MVSSTAQDQTTAPGPDWPSITDEIHCPLCQYNLRGLIEPRCPECGYRFLWPEVLDPERRQHPYVFDQHPENCLRSLWRTMVGSLWPGRFWRELRPSQPSRPEWLYVYWGIVNLAVLAILLPGWAIEWLGYSRGPGLWFITPRGIVARQFGDGASMLSILAEPLLRCKAQTLLDWTIGCLLAWPVATRCLLRLFQESTARARVKGDHVRRCVLYSYGLLLWAGPLMAMASTIILWMMGPSTAGWSYEVAVDICVLGALATWPVVTYHLAVAYRLYLRFDHPVATVVSTQIIILLVTLLGLLVARHFY